MATATSARGLGGDVAPDIITAVPAEFGQKAELERISEELGRLYFEALKDADEDARSKLGAYFSTYDAKSITDGPSGTVVVVSTLLSRLTQEEARDLAVELAHLLSRYA